MDKASGVITSETEFEKKELFCNIYVCPVCNSKTLVKDFNYCPNCGARIVWNFGEKREGGENHHDV